jgi:thermitase
MLLVAAAGNAPANIDNYPMKFYPASDLDPNVIAVAATDQNDRFASFSNSGPKTIHVGAPGVNILSTFLNGGYAYGSGTSMATPHVTGAALLVLSACPWLNSQEVKQVLLGTVDAMSSDYEFMISGGRLNAGSAVRACASSPALPSLTVN